MNNVEGTHFCKPGDRMSVTDSNGNRFTIVFLEQNSEQQTVKVIIDQPGTAYHGTILVLEKTQVLQAPAN